MPRSIVLATEVDATPSTVFEALSTTAGLAAFWTPSVSGSTDVGSTLSFGFAAAPVDLEMVVTASQPDRVEWECRGPWPHWGGTQVEWRIGAGPPSTVLFVQRGWSDDQPDVEFGSVAMTWAMVLGALKAYSESGAPQPALA